MSKIKMIWENGNNKIYIGRNKSIKNSIIKEIEDE